MGKYIYDPTQPLNLADYWTIIRILQNIPHKNHLLPLAEPSTIASSYAPLVLSDAKLKTSLLAHQPGRCDITIKERHSYTHGFFFHTQKGDTG